MQWFNHLRIAAKLALSFGAVLLLALSVGACALWSMARMDDAADELSANWLPSVVAVMQMRVDLGEARRWELAHLLSSTPARMADYEARDARTLAAFAQHQAQYAALVASPAEAAIFRTISSLAAEFIEEHRKILILSRAMKKEEGRAVTLARSAVLMTQLSERISALVALNVVDGAHAGQVAGETYARARLWTGVLLAACVVLGILVALALARSVTAPLAQAVAVARQVAAGDLTGRIDVRHGGEAGQLMRALQDMHASLRALVS